MSEQNDLSTQAGINLLELSFSLNRRVSAQGIGQTIGEFCGKFYLLDFTTNSITRLTLGAFRHLSQAWTAQATLAA